MNNLKKKEMIKLQVICISQNDILKRFNYTKCLALTVLFFLGAGGSAFV